MPASVKLTSCNALHIALWQAGCSQAPCDAQRVQAWVEVPAVDEAKIRRTRDVAFARGVQPMQRHVTQAVPRSVRDRPLPCV